MATVLPCSCKHEHQDKLYGPGMRVFNTALKGEGLRCSVCLAVKKLDKTKK